MLLKRIFVFLNLSLLVCFGQAQTTKSAKETQPKTSGEERLVWLDWNEGYAKAVKSGKVVLVDAYTEWCGWCKKMDRDTYTQAEIIHKINSDFVPVKFNPEVENRVYKIDTMTLSGVQLYGLLTQGNATGFPTTYFIFPARKKIMLEVGYKGPEAFLGILNQVVEQGKK